MASTVRSVHLKQQTMESFASYIRDAEAAMEQNLDAFESFLWSDASPARAQQVRGGEIVAEFWSGQGPVKVPNGLIHDWIGAALIAGATVKNVLAMVQNYDNHKSIYKPEVIASKLIRRQGSDFQIYLRLLKKKIVTVVLDTDHDVHYRHANGTRWICCSRSTRIAEVESAGTPEEQVRPPDTGHGFLWRLHSYWRFQERDDGVVVECRAVSLTRDVPFGLAWVIEPVIQKLPKESLINTLQATRHGMLLGANRSSRP